VRTKHDPYHCNYILSKENAGTSLVEAFSLLEIRTHLQMLQTSAAGAKSQAQVTLPYLRSAWSWSVRLWHELT